MKAGDRVRTIRPVMNSQRGWRPVAAGVVGVLGNLNRVQDGMECWTMWLDEKIEGSAYLGVTDSDVEVIS